MSNLEELSLNILIVEDSLSFALELEMMVEDIGYHVIGRVDNSSDAFEVIYAKKPDLIMMDIDIKGSLTGIEIAERIKEEEIPVLFITSFDQEEYYQKAKKTNLIGYLIKPVNKYSLKSSIELAFKQQLEKGNPALGDTFIIKQSIFFKKKDILYKVKISDINFVKADGDYTISHTQRGIFHTSLRLSEMQEILTLPNFIKIHRSYIINIEKIHSVNVQDNFISIEDQQIPISRRNKQQFLQKINRVK